MGWLEWTASVIGSVAWPIAAVVIAAFFRSQIAGLLEKIRRLSWGDASVDFAEKLDEIESASREIDAGAGAQLTIPPAIPDERFTKLLEISPSAAIMDAWGPIETKLRSMSADIQSSAQSYAPRQMMLMLLKRGIISPELHEILRDLSNLRNAAVHQREVTVTDAIRFRDFSLKAIAELDFALQRKL